MNTVNYGIYLLYPFHWFHPDFISLIPCTGVDLFYRDRVKTFRPQRSDWKSLNNIYSYFLLANYIANCKYEMKRWIKLSVKCTVLCHVKAKYEITYFFLFKYKLFIRFGFFHIYLSIKAYICLSLFCEAMEKRIVPTVLLYRHFVTFFILGKT